MRSGVGKAICRGHVSQLHASRSTRHHIPKSTGRIDTQSFQNSNSARPSTLPICDYVKKSFLPPLDGKNSPMKDFVLTGSSCASLQSWSIGATWVERQRLKEMKEPANNFWHFPFRLQWWLLFRPPQERRREEKDMLGDGCLKENVRMPKTTSSFMLSLRINQTL